MVEILAIVVSMLAFGFSLFSYIQTREMKKRENNCDKINTALQMARYYMEEIIPELSRISSEIKRNKDVDNIINRIKAQQAKLFTQEEISSIFDKEADREKLKEFFSTFVHHDLCNKLEYFSMAFIQNVADDDVVYQSLHQTFLYIVLMLYFPIANENTYLKEHEKRFSNLRQLFLRWNERQYNEGEEHTQRIQDNSTRVKTKRT